MHADDFPQAEWKQNGAELPQTQAAGENCAMARRRDREAVVGRRLALFG